MKIMEDRAPEFGESLLVRYTIFRIKEMKIFDGKMYIESDLCTAKMYTCTLKKPRTSPPIQANPRAIIISITTSKALGWPFHLCQTSWGEDFDGCWGGHHLVRL